MAERLKKPSSASKTKPRAWHSSRTGTPHDTAASTTRSTGNSSAPSGPADKPSISRAEVERETKRYRRKADRYRDDPKKTEELLKDAEQKARKAPGPISAQMEDLATLVRMVRAYFSKEYREMPWETIALVIGAIVYFVSPVDLIPDFIPVAGYVDDVAVIGFVIASATNDLHNFREWEARRQLDT